MTDAGTTQDNFILPAPPVGLPISQQKIMNLLAKSKKGFSSIIYCKVWRHKSESEKIIYLDATESLISSRGARCSSVMNRRTDPSRWTHFQPVLHNWYNKGCDMCYPVYGMIHIK